MRAQQCILDLLVSLPPCRPPSENAVGQIGATADYCRQTQLPWIERNIKINNGNEKLFRKNKSRHFGFYRSPSVLHNSFSLYLYDYLYSYWPVARLKGSEKSVKVSARYPASGGPSKAEPPLMKVKTPAGRKDIKYYSPPEGSKEKESTQGTK